MACAPRMSSVSSSVSGVNFGMFSGERGRGTQEGNDQRSSIASGRQIMLRLLDECFDDS